MMEFYNVERNKHEFRSKWIPRFWVTVSIRWLNRLWVFRNGAKEEDKWVEEIKKVERIFDKVRADEHYCESCGEKLFLTGTVAGINNEKFMWGCPECFAHYMFEVKKDKLTRFSY